MGTNDIKRNSYDNIKRMMNGESILRIGPIWYGLNRSSTVANIYYISNKKVNMIPTLRTEVAMSFSSTLPPVDTIQVELVVHYSMFKSTVQKLFALAQLMPVVPVNNSVIAAITQPIEHNQRIYRAYGYSAADEIDVHALSEPNPNDTPAEQKKKKDLYSITKEMYCAVPVHMKIDNIRLETIQGIPRDIRILVRLTRALTVNSYGDRVEYLTDMDSVVKQTKFMSEIGDKEGDIPQMQAITDLLGINTSELDNMITELERVTNSANAENLTNYVVSSIVSGDHLKVYKKGTTKIIDIKIAGIDTPLYNKNINNKMYTQPYGQNAYKRLKTLLREGTVIKLKYLGKLPNVPKGSDFRACNVYIEKEDEIGNTQYVNIARILLKEGLAFTNSTYISEDEYRVYSSDMEDSKSAQPVRGIWKEKTPESPSSFIKRLKDGRKQ